MKIRPTVFLKAAEMIASGRVDFCCAALKFYGASRQERLFFADLFRWDREGHKSPSIFWWRNGKSYSTEARIIALLLAHEIAKGGGL